MAFAEWPSDPTVNVPICTAAGDQYTPQLVSDGAGGAIIVWEDHRSNTHIYAQRVNSNGVVLWTTNGVLLISTDTVYYQSYPQLISDGVGGAIIVWEYHLGGSARIYAQRVNSNGVMLWTTDGVPICTAAENQEHPQLVSDGSGGAIITWYDSRSGNYDIYAQRINANGVVLWAIDGVPICTAANNQSLPQLVSDGAGGAIITWQDTRSGNWHIYAQRVNANGVVLWTTNGVPICTTSNTEQYLQLVSDGSGGAIITWYDSRSGNADIYTQRVNSNGVVLWTTDGVPICTAANTQQYPRLVSDEIGGAIISWQDGRGSDKYPYIYAQRVNANGIVLWTTNGIPICIEIGSKNPQLVRDGTGDVLVMWQDYYRSFGSIHIYAQRVNTSGTVLWKTNGVPICTAASGRRNHQLVRDGTGGAIITWRDSRSGIGYYDIYAQNVNPDGTLGGISGGGPFLEPIRLVENDPAYPDSLNAGYYQKYKFAVTADGRQYTITVTPTSGDADLYYRNLDSNISPFVPSSYDASSKHPGASVEQLSFIAPLDGKDYTVYPAVLAVTNSHYTIRVTSGAPGGLTLQSPTNGSHITASPTFQWGQVPDVLYYELVLAKDANFTQPIWNRSAIGGSETSVAYSGSAALETGQTYYWRMRFQNVNQVWSNWTNAWSFVKDAPAEQLPAPNLSAPANGANVALPEMFSWQAVPNAVRYIVQVASGGDFANVLWSGQSSTNAITVPQTSEVLKTSEVYYWRAAGINSGGNTGNYSNGYSFTLVETILPPAKPTPTSPSSGATINTQQIPFSWTSAPSATAYALRYSVDATFPTSSAKTWTVSDITATSYTVALPLTSATTIYWQVSSKNAGGNSGWTDAISFNYAPPVTSKVTSVKIDLPKNGLSFLQDAALGAHAYMTGTYEGKITGAWYLDGEHYADFTTNMTPANGAEISITGLPTWEIKPRTIQVRLTSPNAISSNAVTYYVAAIQPGTPAKLRLTANPTAIKANGASTSTLTAQVLDGYGYLVSGDKDRVITFSVSGEGKLSSPTALTQNGKATVTLQSTTTPDNHVTVTASAEGLASSDVIVQTYTSSVEPYLTWTRADASRLADIGFNISGVEDFLRTQIEVPNPTLEAIESLKRLELMLDLMVKAYYGTKFDEKGTPTDGAMILIHDFSENIGSVIALAVEYPFIIQAILAKAADDIPWAGVWLTKFAQTVAQKTIDFVADLAGNITDIVGRGPVADAVQVFIKTARETVHRILDEKMSGESVIDPVGLSGFVIEEIVAIGGPILASQIYVSYTQPVLDQAVSLAQSNKYGGTYEDAKNSATNAHLGISVESEIIHKDVESNSMKMQVLPGMQELLTTWNVRDKIGFKEFALAVGNALLNFLDLRKWGYSINSATETLIVVKRIANDRIPNSISGVFGVAVSPAAPQQLAQIQSNAPRPEFHRLLMRQMQAEIADYDSVVREILFTLENDDLEGVIEKLEGLLDADAQLSSDMTITASAIGAATTSAFKTIPDFDQMYNDSSFARSDATGQQTLFLNALMNYLIDPEDDTLRHTAIDSGYAALQANVTASDELVQTVTGVFTTPAYPYVLVTSVKFSTDQLSLHDIFTITAKIMNAGAGMAHNVKVELSADDSVALLSAAIIDIGDLDSGSERTVSWQLEVVSNTGQAGFVNLSLTSDDAINVDKMIPFYLNETNTLPLVLGLNLCSLAVQPQTPLTAHQVIRNISSCVKVARWDETTQSWESAIDIAPPSKVLIGPDFPLEVGKGDFVQCTAADTWVQSGFKINNPVPLPFVQGLNLSAIPFPADSYTSNRMIQEISSCVKVAHWDDTTQSWESAIDIAPPSKVLIGPDFPIKVGKGYFVQVTSAETWTPNAVQAAPQKPLREVVLPPVVVLPAAIHPRISQVQVSNLTSASATVTWSTNEASDSVVLYGPTSALDWQARQAPFSATQHQVRLVGLQPNTTYYYTVRSGDTRHEKMGAFTTGAIAAGMPYSVFGQLLPLRAQCP